MYFPLLRVCVLTMQRQIVLIALVAIWMAQAQQPNYNKQSEKDWCSRVCPLNNTKCSPPCPACPTIPACPQPICPVPKCPSLSAIPKCPQPNCPTPACPRPVCPALPPIPQCPKPVCPTPVCNNAASCPKCTPCPQPPKTPSVRKGRPAGYEGIPCAPVGIYKYYASALSWIEANNTCARDGAHLIIPKNTAELEALKSIMRKYNNNLAVYVGFHDIQKEGHFFSVLGAPLDSFQLSMWERGQPSGSRAENCVVIRHYGGMHDYTCEDKLAFVCEVPY